MRIAILVTTFPPYHGGMGRVAETQARLLSELGHEVAVFAAKGESSHSGASAYRFWRLRPLFAIGNGAFVPQLYWRLNNFDAVFLHYPAFGFIETALFWRLTCGRRKKFFVFYHMDPIASGLKGAIFKFLTALFGIPLFKSAEKILVSSLDYAHAGELGKMPASIRQKLLELPLAVDTDLFSPGECATDSRQRFHCASKNILFVGGMDRAHDFKGVTVLLEAFARVKDGSLRLHLVGRGELISDYERLAASLGLGERVIFHGALTAAELRDLYRCSDLLVLPSVNRSEAFGLVLLEVGSCGRAVIASDLPGVRTVVVSDVGWLTPPGDPRALATTISTALNNSELLKEMGQRARQRVVENYSLERLKSALAKLLSSKPNA